MRLPRNQEVSTSILFLSSPLYQVKEAYASKQQRTQATKPAEVRLVVKVKYPIIGSHDSSEGYIVRRWKMIRAARIANKLGE